MDGGSGEGDVHLVVGAGVLRGIFEYVGGAGGVAAMGEDALADVV